MIDAATLRRLWPHAPDPIVADTAARSAAVFAKYDLSTPLRVAHFMAQISHESGGGTITEESLNYTSAARIAQVWPSRFTPESAQAFVRKPRDLANRVYNGRMGNRPNTDDGYNFRGRGFLQLTGRDAYAKLGAQLGLDLVNNPGLVNAYDKRLEIAVAEFVSLGCLPACDADDIRAVTKRVNGGYIGIDSRREWLAKWKLALPGLPGVPPTAEDTEEMAKPLPRQADGDPVMPTKSDKLTERLTLASTTLPTILGALTDWRVAIVLCMATIVGLVAFFVLKRRGYFE